MCTGNRTTAFRSWAACGTHCSNGLRMSDESCVRLILSALGSRLQSPKLLRARPGRSSRPIGRRRSNPFRHKSSRSSHKRLSLLIAKCGVRKFETKKVWHRSPLVSGCEGSILAPLIRGMRAGSLRVPVSHCLASVMLRLKREF